MHTSERSSHLQLFHADKHSNDLIKRALKSCCSTLDTFLHVSRLSSDLANRCQLL